MDLDAIYAVSIALNQLAQNGDIRYEDIDEAITVNIDVNAIRHYGIDKELYRKTHDGSDEGFVHSNDPIEATINDVKFIIRQKDTEPFNDF